MPEGVVTIVTGVPRSGTSLMMRMLEAGGLPPLCDAARPADRHNPRGYYELSAVKQLAAREPGRLPWLEQAEGHAVKIVHALLPRLPEPPAGREYRVLWMRRELGAVLASQREMAADAGAEDAVLARVLRAQLAELEAWLGAHVSGRWLRVDYEGLLEEPAPALAAIDALLGGGLDRSAMAAVIEAELCHHY